MVLTFNRYRCYRGQTWRGFVLKYGNTRRNHMQLRRAVLRFGVPIPSFHVTLIGWEWSGGLGLTSPTLDGCGSSALDTSRPLKHEIWLGYTITYWLVWWLLALRDFTTESTPAAHFQK